MIFPGDVGRLDEGPPGAAAGPRNQLLDGVFLTFADYFHAAVGEVPDPARQPEALCLTLGAVPKEDALHYSVYDYMRSCLHGEKAASWMPKNPPTPVHKHFIVGKRFFVLYLSQHSHKIQLCWPLGGKRYVQAGNRYRFG